MKVELKILRSLAVFHQGAVATPLRVFLFSLSLTHLRCLLKENAFLDITQPPSTIFNKGRQQQQQ